jgi:hypothetical protein
MNFKRQAERLEQYLEAEFKNTLPIAVMANGSVVYKNFKIKQNKRGNYSLYRIGGNLIDTFNLKACALMAAKYYSVNSLTPYNEVKDLDNNYHQNSTDAEIFKHKYKTYKDLDKRDLALWRWELTSERAKRTKSQIEAKFKAMF